MSKNFARLSVRCLVPAAIFLLAACGDKIKTDTEYADKSRTEMYKQGSLASGHGGIDLLGGDKVKDAASGITVNAYLWRAAIDTVSFMPLVSADPFGGVILTDWYSRPAMNTERMKLNVFILDRELRADGVKVKAFRQTRSGNDWVDAEVAPNVAPALEEAILTRARQLKIGGRKTDDR